MPDKEDGLIWELPASLIGQKGENDEGRNDNKRD